MLFDGMPDKCYVVRWHYMNHYGGVMYKVFISKKEALEFYAHLSHTDLDALVYSPCESSIVYSETF